MGYMHNSSAVSDWKCHTSDTSASSQYQNILPSYRDSHVKDKIIFKMRILILVRPPEKLDFV